MITGAVRNLVRIWLETYRSENRLTACAPLPRAQSSTYLSISTVKLSYCTSAIYHRCEFISLGDFCSFLKINMIYGNRQLLTCSGAFKEFPEEHVKMMHAIFPLHRVASAIVSRGTQSALHALA